MLEIHEENEVLEIRFDRPEIKNAASAELLDQLHEVLEGLHSKTTDVCVLTGNGDAFCAGGDIKSMAEREETPIESYERLQGTLNPVIDAIVSSTVPIISKVNGDAIGAGANIAFATDFVYADENARFGEPYIHVGLVPDGGGTVFLPYYTSLRTVKELFMTGRLFNATEAQELGLINAAISSDELDSEVEQLVSELKDKPSDILGLTKQLLHRNLGRPYEDGLNNESNSQVLAYYTDSHKEAIQKFLE